jgi:hypothetical protein
MVMHQCKHGCGYEHVHKGAMNLHERIHCKTLRKESEAAAEKVEPAEKPAKKKKADCEHSWRLLVTSREAEARAIQAGFVEVCRKCQSVQ